MNPIRNTVTAMLSAAMLAGLFTTGARAQTATRPMVEWVLPATPTNKPQTEHQAEEARQKGRDLPAPVKEFLRYVLSRQGQEPILYSGYFPLTSSEVAEELAKLD